MSGVGYHVSEKYLIPIIPSYSLRALKTEEENTSVWVCWLVRL